MEVAVVDWRVDRWVRSRLVQPELLEAAMSAPMEPRKTIETHTIYSPDGDRYILAATEEEALAEIDQDEEELKDIGWMCVVPYPELYDSREEWEESPDFTEPWWESCQRPADDKPTATVLRAWEVHYR